MIRIRRGRAPLSVREHDLIDARRRFEQIGSEGGTRATQTVLSVDSALGTYQSQAAVCASELLLGKCAYSNAMTSPLLHRHRPETILWARDGVSAERTPGSQQCGGSTGTPRKRGAAPAETAILVAGVKAGSKMAKAESLNANGSVTEYLDRYSR